MDEVQHGAPEQAHVQVWCKADYDSSLALLKCRIQGRMKQKC